MSEFENTNEQFPNLELNWKNVFYIGNKSWYGGISEVSKIAKLGGFPYYTWFNYKIYQTNNDIRTYVIFDHSNDKFIWDKFAIEEHYLGKKIAKMNRHVFENGESIVTVSGISTDCRLSSIPILLFDDLKAKNEKKYIVVGEYARDCYIV